MLTVDSRCYINEDVHYADNGHWSEQTFSWSTERKWVMLTWEKCTCWRDWGLTPRSRRGRHCTPLVVELSCPACISYGGCQHVGRMTHTDESLTLTPSTLSLEHQALSPSSSPPSRSNLFRELFWFVPPPPPSPAAEASFFSDRDDMARASLNCCKSSNSLRCLTTAGESLEFRRPVICEGRLVPSGELLCNPSLGLSTLPARWLWEWNKLVENHIKHTYRKHHIGRLWRIRIVSEAIHRVTGRVVSLLKTKYSKIDSLWCCQQKYSPKNLSQPTRLIFFLWLSIGKRDKERQRVSQLWSSHTANDLMVMIHFDRSSSVEAANL